MVKRMIHAEDEAKVRKSKALTSTNSDSRWIEREIQLPADLKTPKVTPNHSSVLTSARTGFEQRRDRPPHRV